MQRKESSRIDANHSVKSFLTSLIYIGFSKSYTLAFKTDQYV